MSEPQAHHVVPQFHLRRFADKKNRVRMVSRDLKLSFTTSVRKACVENEFYTVETTGGPSQDVEKLLALVEGEAAPVVDRFLRGEFPGRPSDREAVALFMAYHCLRGDETRDAWAQLVDHAVKLQMANMTRADLVAVFTEKEGREPAEDEIAELRATMSKLRDVVKAVPHSSGSIEIMLRLAPRLAESFLARKWLLFDVGEPCLLTSDAGIERWSDPKKPGAWMYGRGWATADEVFMPLSPRRCILLRHDLPDNDQRVWQLGRSVGPKYARGVNHAIAARARRWIIHHPDSDPLKGLDIPPKSSPLRIDGPSGRIIPDDA